MCGKHDRCAGAARSHAAEINLAIAETIGIGHGGLALSADGSLHASGKLSRAERLGNVVICSEFKQQNLIHNFTDSTEDDDGRFVGDRFECLTELTARDTWEDEIENNGRWVLGPE